ncbi:MAG: hypothetical protein IKU97_02960 [Tidjanibacter sp.]|nr:hypothetical protein [Tidjanibacter sp.]
MTRLRNIAAVVALLATLSLMSSCGSGTFALASGTSATYTDDLYATHDRVAIAKAEKALADAEAAAAKAREEKIQAMINAAKAEADLADILGDVELNGVTTTTSTAAAGTVVNNTYNIYVDDYESAYARRLKGFSSATYKLPSAYWDYRYGDAYFLTMAYDPAFYTVMVMGDQVWVEPRYITAMFGSWGRPYYYRYSAWDYYYNPFYYDYYWGWYHHSPYYCHHYNPYYHHTHHWHAPHYGHKPPHKPAPAPAPGGSHKPGTPGGGKSPVVHRPSYASGNSSARPSSGRPSYADRLNGSRSEVGTAPNNGTVSAGGSNSSRPTGGKVTYSTGKGSSIGNNRNSSASSSSSSSGNRSSVSGSNRSGNTRSSSSSSYSSSSRSSSSSYSGSSYSGSSNRGGSYSGSRSGTSRR